MGCDIHLQVERREADGWRRVPHVERPCEKTYCENGTLSDEVPNEKMRGEPCWHCKGAALTTEAFFSDRNYDVFGILANVRNGSGFAGSDTGDGFVPISDPRGLPADLSPEIVARLMKDGYRLPDDDGEPEYVGREDEDAEDEDWQDPQHFNMGDHSWTWLGVPELLAYDWDRTTKKRGWVDPWNFELWRRDGRPRSWSGGITGASIEHVSNQQIARMIDDGEIEWEGDEPPGGSWQERPYSTPLQRGMREMGVFPEGSVGARMTEVGSRYFTLVEWEVAYREQAEHFLTVLHRDILPLGAPDGLRLVFGFDS